MGATLMHCMTGALMGLAWHQIITRRRWSRGLALYAGSAAIHGLWNGVALTITVMAIKAGGSGNGEATQALTGLGTLIMLLLQLGLALCIAGGLAGVLIYARRSLRPVAATKQARPESVGAHGLGGDGDATPN
jgi:hypothetical protein